MFVVARSGLGRAEMLTGDAESDRAMLQLKRPRTRIRDGPFVGSRNNAVGTIRMSIVFLGLLLTVSGSSAGGLATGGFSPLQRIQVRDQIRHLLRRESRPREPLLIHEVQHAGAVLPKSRSEARRV